MQNNNQRTLPVLFIMSGIIAVSIVIWAIVTPRPLARSLPTASSKQIVGLQVGEKAPSFTLLASDRHQIHLSDFLGQPVVILFSAADCSSCETQLSDAQPVYAAQYCVHHLFALLGIDLSDTSASVMHYDTSIQSPYPDILTQHSNVATLYRITGVPTSVFIDRTGVIRAIVKGEMDVTALQHYVQQISA